MTPKLLKYRILWQSLGWLLLLTIIILSLLPNVSVPDLGFSASDKAGHFLAYFTLTTWFGLIYERTGHHRIALGFFAMGAAMELMQMVSGYRLMELADLLANSAGILIGWLLLGTRLSQGLVWLEGIVRK